MSLLITPGGAGPVHTLHVRGEVDLATAPLLARHLAASIQRRPRRIALDARELTFMDCAGIAVLSSAAAELRQQLLPPPLILRPRAQVLRVLTLSGASRWLDLCAIAPPDPRETVIDLSDSTVTRRLSEAQAVIEDAIDHCDVLRWERARLDFAALAFWTCEQLSARGHAEPDGLRAQALMILSDVEGTRS